MQKNKHKKMRLVVDANAWISSLMSLRFRFRLAIVFDPAYLLLTSEELFSDLKRGIQKPKVTKKITPADYEKLVSRLRSAALFVNVRSVVNVCRDPEDNFLLALAKDGNADYLITGDLDLLVMKEFENTKIVSLTDFEKEQKPEWSAAK